MDIEVGRWEGWFMTIIRMRPNRDFETGCKSISS